MQRLLVAETSIEASEASRRGLDIYFYLHLFSFLFLFCFFLFSFFIFFSSFFYSSICIYDCVLII